MIEVEGEVSVYNPATASVVVLNRTASDVWVLSDGTQTQEGIASLLAASYGVPVETVRDDVGATIARLVAAGVLTGPGTTP